MPGKYTLFKIKRTYKSNGMTKKSVKGCMSVRRLHCMVQNRLPYCIKGFSIFAIPDSR